MSTEEQIREIITDPDLAWTEIVNRCKYYGLTYLDCEIRHNIHKDRHIQRVKDEITRKLLP